MHGITPQTVIKSVRDLIEIGLGKAKEEKLADAPKKKLSAGEKASLAEELTKQMKDIKQGKSYAPLELNSNDEIRVLNDSFNSMIETIQLLKID